MEDVKWLEVTLDTTEAELDALCARLTGNGVTGLAIEDEEDFKTFLEQNRQYWDYVDDGLLARMKGVCRVKFYITNADIPWYKSHGAYIWQQSICWTFILLAGFSWHLGKKHMKRGLWAFGGGVVISLVTAIVLPNDRVRYGVLTLIGSCILIWILLDKVLKKIPAGVGVSVSFVLFLILRSWTKQDPIQLSLSDNLLNVTWLKSVLAYIGFPQAGFSSTDYFPLLPWIFLFATGYFLYSFLQEKGLINRLFGK